MRLMPGYVEILHAEREVHRIDVFEVRRQKRNVRDQEETGKRGERGSHWGGKIRQDADAVRRSSSRDDIHVGRW
jgi:hypothetical protein